MENPILVEVYRSGIIESFHRGAVCVVNENGEIVFELGDSNQICFPRSAMKFVQVLPLIELGGIKKFGFNREEIAIMCGSHNAEPLHLAAVRSILTKIGVDESTLGCGAQYPTDKKTANELVQTKTKPSAIHNNCSGKHAGMLALCLLMGESTSDYLNPNHPIQKLILRYVSEMYEYPIEKMTCALDGCTAPIYSIPVYNQAICFKNLVDPKSFSAKRQEACATLIQSISEFPFMVAGSKRYCTDMMEICAPQIIGKTGAEGVFCLSFTKQKLGVCIKIDDGKMLPQYNVAQALIEASGLFSKEELEPIHRYAEDELKNFNNLVTGTINVNSKLFENFREIFH
ncbi:MAG: asparaginase [Bacteroidia bacterium]|nr:asparaginase [Bacteroidia bacterium]MCF8425519.1 asparaginase [Bacteroidia bacterium]MCF8445832.1 asparaginase [Bacteroidia bacterium]